MTRNEMANLIVWGILLVWGCTFIPLGAWPLILGIIVVIAFLVWTVITWDGEGGGY